MQVTNYEFVYSLIDENRQDNTIQGFMEIYRRIENEGYFVAIDHESNFTTKLSCSHWALEDVEEKFYVLLRGNHVVFMDYRFYDITHE